MKQLPEAAVVIYLGYAKVVGVWKGVYLLLTVYLLP